MSEEKSKSTIPNIPKVHGMPTSTKETPLKNNVGPSALRQLLPIVSCLLSFASVLTVLIIYMDKTGEFFFFLILRLQMQIFSRHFVVDNIWLALNKNNYRFLLSIYLSSKRHTL